MAKPIVTAIPVCRNRIAFHFAWCTHVLIVETIGNRILRRQIRPMSFAEPWDMARALVAMNIDQLVCRAMPGYFRDWFESKHVRIIDCQQGATQELVEQCRRQLEETKFDEEESGGTPIEPVG